MSDSHRPTPQPLVFGEVLFDHFPDGSRVLGGAPFNVAWHLQGFGLSPLFVSAVGADETGREVLDRMEEWGMETAGVQVARSHPTGRVTAEIVDGEPVFEIGSEQAYDYVRGDAALDALGSAAVPVVYHGTLALRGQVSRDALAALRGATNAPTFVDLNLREPWWTRDRLDACLEGASWLKLNRDELAIMAGESTETVRAAVDCAHALADSRGLATVIVTLGAHGSLMVRAGASWVRESERMATKEVVDTVGAGDAFSAVACVGMVEEWDSGDILERGNAFAGDFCRIRGATTRDRSVYERHLAAWGRA
jgi:fructokinase